VPGRNINGKMTGLEYTNVNTIKYVFRVKEELKVLTNNFYKNILI